MRAAWGHLHHQLSQSCPGLVLILIPGVPEPCLPSSYSSAPMGCSAPASASSPHSAANAATLMQNKELSAPGRRREPLSLHWVPSGNQTRACLEGVSSALLQRFKNRHQQPAARHGSFWERHPWLGKVMHSVGGTALRDREHGETGHSPFSAPEWSNKELFICSQSYGVKNRWSKTYLAEH